MVGGVGGGKGGGWSAAGMGGIGIAARSWGGMAILTRRGENQEKDMKT